MNMVIESIGWLASLLIIGSYALNITGRLQAKSKWYVLANIVGGTFFVINTYYHQAYPSMVVNIVWVIIALIMILKQK